MKSSTKLILAILVAAAGIIVFDGMFVVTQTQQAMVFQFGKLRAVYNVPADKTQLKTAAAETELIAVPVTDEAPGAVPKDQTSDMQGDMQEQTGQQEAGQQDTALDTSETPAKPADSGSKQVETDIDEIELPFYVDNTPGLKFKLPFVQNVVFYENRLLELDPPVEEVILSDQKRLRVDSFTRFRIMNPLLFYKTQRTEKNAQFRLEDVINSVTREVLGNVTLATLLSKERNPIMDKIRKRVARDAEEMGVWIEDVRIRRADLPDEIAQAINARMRSEREREAREFRAEGQELAQRIRARAERERTVIIAEANKESQIIRGAGDKKATEIWANAATQDREFFAFYRSLEGFRKAMDGNNTSMVLSPDSEFFRYFGDIPGVKSRKR